MKTVLVLWRPVIALLCAVLLTACAATSPSSQPVWDAESRGLAAEAAPAPAAPAAGMLRASKLAASIEAEPAQNATLPASSPARKVHYEGEISLRATQPRQTLEQAVAWTREAGGYVESLNARRVVLQIPAARFRAVYDQMLGLGEVLRKSISARDVTEEYVDVELRLNQARTMRDRLLALIQKTEDRKEKLRLMRELERLSAEIELQEARMARMRTLVEYSRLTLDVQERQSFTGGSQRELRGFGWIDTLANGALRPSRETSRYALRVPRGMVELDEATNWSVASPDGATLGTQQRRNEPAGSTAFWVEALRWRLKERFAQVEQKTAGDFVLLRLLSREEPRFVYWVAVAAREQKLYVAQAYFPTPEHEQRYQAQVLESLSGGVK